MNRRETLAGMVVGFVGALTVLGASMVSAHNTPSGDLQSAGSAGASTCAEQAAILGSEATGTCGKVVLSSTPTLITPVLGVATGTSLATTGVIAVASGQLLSVEGLAGDSGIQKAGVSTALVDDGTQSAIFNGGIFYPNSLAISTAGTVILNHMSATATLDFGNLAAIGCEDLTITGGNLTGAAVGDTVAVGIPNGSVPTATGYFPLAWVSAADTVKIRYCDLVAGNPASGTFRVDVWQH